MGAWIERSATLPAANAMSPTMAFSPELNRTILFDSGASNNTTWAYDAPTDVWSAIPDPAALPFALLSSMVYDAAVGKMVLFGGVTGTTLLGQSNATWTYDARDNTWQNVTPAASPPPRFQAGMAYDAGAGRLIVFGGFRFGCLGFCIPEIPWVAYDDTWSYDAVNNTWTNVTPSLSPSARGNVGMAYDPVTRRTVLFGGVLTDGGYTNASEYNDTWTFDAATDTWALAPPAGPSPSPRSAMVMVYDPDASGIVMFGGGAAPAPLNDTWWYWPSTNTWTLVPSTKSPSARGFADAAYDERGREIVLFGGLLGFPPYHAMDTWVYQVVYSPLSATLDASVREGTVPFTFSGRGVAAGGLAPYAFEWDFGDGGQATGASVSHVYAAAGNYTVTLTVSDGAGAHASASIRVAASSPQELAPSPGSTESLPWTLGIAAGVAVLCAVLVAAFLLSRRKEPKD